ncbi:NADH-quinone oxidoreductase subunit A [Bacillus albus]|uniref:NADH-quinone oxidoreductase subunit A n=1 Tax=Bacillus cereus group TaxID=86661 RepID=UPI00141A431F
MFSQLFQENAFKGENSFESFECGFSPISSIRGKFSLHFFIVGVLFLIFDLEVVSSIPAVTIQVSV